MHVCMYVCIRNVYMIAVAREPSIYIHKINAHIYIRNECMLAMSEDAPVAKECKYIHEYIDTHTHQYVHIVVAIACIYYMHIYTYITYVYSIYIYIYIYIYI